MLKGEYNFLLCNIQCRNNVATCSTKLVRSLTESSSERFYENNKISVLSLKMRQTDKDTSFRRKKRRILRDVRHGKTTNSDMQFERYEEKDFLICRVKIVSHKPPRKRTYPQLAYRTISRVD